MAASQRATQTTMPTVPRDHRTELSTQLRIGCRNLLLKRAMGLRETTRQVLDLVERTSGHPVLVTEDRSLKTLATVRMARGDAPAHAIAYNPAADSQPDYLIAYQCGFILRLFANPPVERWDLAGTAQGREIVHQLLGGPDGPARKLNLAPPVVEKLRDQLFDGLMLQLRSIPVGLRVDAWILREYPDLAQLQRSAVLRQSQDNQATLSPDVRKIAPTKVYKGSVSMNAAFALFWARQWNDPALSLPYKSAGFEKAGAQLLAAFDEIPGEPMNDRRLVDAWGTELGLASWYEWVAYSGKA